MKHQSEQHSANGETRVVLPSKNERDTIQRLANTARGLKARAIDRLGPRIMAYSVNSEIKIEDLLSNLYSYEFADMMTEETFKSSIKVVSRQLFQQRNTANILIEGKKMW